MLINRRYLDLIDRTLDAYPRSAIERYFADVRRDGLREHGFPRLTANLGVLLAHGRRGELSELFGEMMDFCCCTVPHVRAGNEFSVRELVCAIEALRQTHAVDTVHIDRWIAVLRDIDPFVCYEKIARTPADRPHNWAVFALVSEWMRGRLCGVDTLPFIELQLGTQLARFDENGMYRDPHEPMVYDLVPRGLLSLLLSCGYRGKYADAIDGLLRRAGLLTLDMQSTTGEIPYGGRSAQFWHNEAILAMTLEYEACRYAAEGDAALSGRFKRGVTLALDHLAAGLAQNPLRHVKNRFPTESGYGCEGYAYFDKYMVTAASFLYAAALICDDSIPPQSGARRAAAQTSAHFHKLFLRAEPYFAELDTAADRHYDASGLGRIHRAGAPSPLCLSLPAPGAPKYRIDSDMPTPFAICPAVCRAGVWTDGTAAVYTIEALTQDAEAAMAALGTTIDGRAVRMIVDVRADGVTVTAEAEGEVALMLPAFAFDGAWESTVNADDTGFTVDYAGCRCIVRTDGSMVDTGGIARNRNGHYRIFRASGQGRVMAYIRLALSD